MRFQHYFPYRTSHLGALHLPVKLPNEQCSPPVPQGTLWAAPGDTTDMMGDEPLGQHMNTQLLITVNQFKTGFPKNFTAEIRVYSKKSFWILGKNLK